MLREHDIHFLEIHFVLLVDLLLLHPYLDINVLPDPFLLDCSLGHRGGDLAEHILDFKQLPVAVTLCRLVGIECFNNLLDLVLDLAKGLDGYLRFGDDLLLILFDLSLRIFYTSLVSFGSSLDLIF